MGQTVLAGPYLVRFRRLDMDVPRIIARTRAAGFGSPKYLFAPGGARPCARAD
jgi:hypothetical protein